MFDTNHHDYPHINRNNFLFGDDHFQGYTITNIDQCRTQKAANLPVNGCSRSDW